MQHVLYIQHRATALSPGDPSGGTMMTTTRRYYTVTSAARLLQVSPSTIWRWIAAGRLPAKRLGPKTIQIAREDLDALAQPAHEAAKNAVVSVEELKRQLTAPPSADELARRQAVVARILEHRTDFVITPLTTTDLIHQAREEEYKSYGLDR
jgi:excisionase family DNA binding protein